MRILVVDNGSSYIDDLLYLLEDNDLSVVSFSSDIALAAKDRDIVILSGGYFLPFETNEDTFRNETSFVKNPPVPVVGICFGSELIARAFGAKVEPLPDREKGIVDIGFKKDIAGLSGNGFSVFENHSLAIRELPPELEEIASSKDGVEIFRHRSLPLWGLQFHPEMSRDESGGDEFITRLLSLIRDGLI